MGTEKSSMSEIENLYSGTQADPVVEGTSVFFIHTNTTFDVAGDYISASGSSPICPKSLIGQTLRYLKIHWLIHDSNL